jgi:aminoglycoside phosphotransferase (APT) family kinase protein
MLEEDRLQFLNRSVEVGPTEEVDLGKLESFLRERFPEAGEGLSVRHFGNGSSNLTYFVRLGSLDVVLRRPPLSGQANTAQDMGREYQILSRLNQVYTLAPRALVYCEDPTVLGVPFYLMEPIAGIVLTVSKSLETRLLTSKAKQMCKSFIENLAALHAVSFVDAGLGDLGKPEGYVERQVNGWIKRYYRSQVESITEVEKVSSWLSAHIPTRYRGALIHNDYHLGNVVFSSHNVGTLVGVLDWEMCTIGDPLMDLGTSLSYWVEPQDPEEIQNIGRITPVIPGFVTRREFAELYAERSGQSLKDIAFYYAFGLFKTAVIVQQIYYRFQRGFMKDTRFAGYFEIARGLILAAARASEHDVV